MSNHHPDNERIKRKYFVFLKEAKQQSEASVDAAAQAIARFEIYTQHRDFRSFRSEQAVAFKRKLTDVQSLVTGEPLSAATRYATLAQLRRFFQWLALQSGYRSRLDYSAAEFFNVSQKDARIATARRPRRVPTLEQVKGVIHQMPTKTEIERRNRAVLAFSLLTGARDTALSSMKIGHVDLVAGNVFQDARDVKTKFSKSFTTFFFPVGNDIVEIVSDWVRYLQTQRAWGADDPLFPATRIELDKQLVFAATGIERKGWKTAAPIRAIFKQAFTTAGLPYFNPHSLRSTLVQLGERVCRTPEDFKAWSQNLGHEGVLTTFRSYGSVATSRQGAILHGLNGSMPTCGPASAADLAEALLNLMKRERLLVAPQGEPGP